MSIEAMRKALSSPVAWRWRFEDQEIWRLHRYRPPHADDSDVICEPLYAAQPPTAPVEPDRQKLFDVLPLQFQDGPDYCTVRDAKGKDFALTVQPDILKEMESALRVALVASTPVRRSSAAPAETSTPAGMSRDDAESMVFDLLDAARSLDQTEAAFRRGAREYYEEMRDKVVSALVTFER